jgi:hypothetical protein
LNNYNGYKSLYECECEFLTRKLPFRDTFEKEVIEDIQKRYPSTHDRLVYVCQGPGGFLSDFLIVQKLLAAGYTNLELLFIEPLLTKNLSILQACLDFKIWCTEQAKVFIKTNFFISIKEYADACKKDPKLRGDIFITIDPDDKKTVPNFESLTFRKKFKTMVKHILQPSASFYYLYFQKISGNPYRHMLVGKLQEPYNEIMLQHWYGIESLQQSRIIKF